MEAVWCSKDRKTAITQAKLGHEIKSQKCGATPVGKQYELGEELGVRGTPAIFTNGGDYIGGYLPPAELVEAARRSQDRGGNRVRRDQRAAASEPVTALAARLLALEQLGLVRACLPTPWHPAARPSSR